MVYVCVFCIAIPLLSNHLDSVNPCINFQTMLKMHVLTWCGNVALHFERLDRSPPPSSLPSIVYVLIKFILYLQNPDSICPNVYKIFLLAFNFLFVLNYLSLSIHFSFGNKILRFLITLVIVHIVYQWFSLNLGERCEMIIFCHFWPLLR